MANGMKNLKRILGNTRGSLPLLESLALKAVSVLLALILWITILSLKAEDRKINVKLEPLLPPGMVVTNKIPSFIQFTLTGPRVWLKETEKKIQPIRPDLRKSRDTTIGFAISDDLIGELPVGVKVLNFYPPQILIRLEEVVERYVNVKPTFSGSPIAGFELGSIKVFPSKVAVTGPRGMLEEISSVGTEPFDITDLSGAKEGTVKVEVDESQGFSLSRGRDVKVRVTVKKVNVENGEGHR